MSLARNTDPITSHLAAASIEDHRTIHHGKILTALRVYGPLGKDGIARRIGLSGVAVARRLPELYKMFAIEPTGNLVNSETGRKEREWRAI